MVVFPAATALVAALAAIPPVHVLCGVAAGCVMLYLAFVRRFQVHGAGEFAVLLAVLLAALAAASSPSHWVREAFQDVPPKTYNAVKDAIEGRILPSLDRILKSVKDAATDTTPETDPDEMGVVLSEEDAGGEAALLELKRANYFLCKSKTLSPVGHARLVKALAAKAGGFTPADEPPMPPEDPNARKFEDDGNAGGDGGGGAKKGVVDDGKDNDGCDKREEPKDVSDQSPADQSK